MHGVIDPAYYKHINNVLHAQTDYELKLFAGIFGSTVRHAISDSDHHSKCVHIMTHIKHRWSGTPRTDGSLGWLPFVSMKTCSIVLKNEPIVRMQCLYPDHTISVKPGEYVIYDYDTTPYRDVCIGHPDGEYKALNIQYMFVPHWLPLPIIQTYKWLYGNTEWLHRNVNGAYLTVLLLITFAKIKVKSVVA